MSDDYRPNFSKNSVKKKHRRVIVFLSLILVMAIAAIIIFIWMASRPDNSYQPEGDLKSDSFYPLKTFETPYFSFEADKTWDFIKGESSNNSFVYRSSKNGIVMRDMTVYVDSLPSNPLLTYVLPVEPVGDRFSVGEVSDHCKDYLRGKIKQGDNNPVDAVITGVRIKCQVDGTSATVGTGLKNGSYQTTLSGKKNGAKQYYLLYHDLQYTPDLDTFMAIARTFQAK